MKTSRAALKERATLMLKGPEEQFLPVVTSTQPGPDLSLTQLEDMGCHPSACILDVTEYSTTIHCLEAVVQWGPPEAGSCDCYSYNEYFGVDPVRFCLCVKYIFPKFNFN